MAEKYYQTVGRRKSAVAQVRLFPGGKGKVTVNDRDIKEYFKTEAARQTVVAPLVTVGKQGDVDITVRVVGGGPTGQSDAIKMGIARALVALDEELRKTKKAFLKLGRDEKNSDDQ